MYDWFTYLSPVLQWRFWPKTEDTLYHWPFLKPYTNFQWPYLASVCFGIPTRSRWVAGTPSQYETLQIIITVIVVADCCDTAQANRDEEEGYNVLMDE